MLYREWHVIEVGILYSVGFGIGMLRRKCHRTRKNNIYEFVYDNGAKEYTNKLSLTMKGITCV